MSPQERVEAINSATDYLATGGIGEVIGLTDISWKAGFPKVQLDTDMAMALAMLADEALKARQHHSGGRA